MQTTEVIADGGLEELIVSQSLASKKLTSLLVNSHGLSGKHFSLKHCGDLFNVLSGIPDGGDRSSGAVALEYVRVTGATLADANQVVARIAAIASEGVDASLLNGEAAERLKTLWRWRCRQDAATHILTASQSLDPEELSQGLRLLDDSSASQASTSVTAKEWGAMMYEWMHEEDSDAIPTPFEELNKTLSGGFRRGELTVLGGYTSHGKSVLADQILDFAVDSSADLRAHLYMSEMTFIERGQRIISRTLGIPMRRVRSKEFSQSEYKDVIELFKSMRHGASLTESWTIEELAQDIKRCEWDIAVVDLIHGFDYSDVYGLEKIMRLLSGASKGTGHNKGTAIIATSHLNDTQITGDGKGMKSNPRPQLRNLKGSSAIKQYADNVMFVWRETDQYQQISDYGQVWTAKGRQSGLMPPLDVKLDTASMRFIRQ